MEKVAAKNEFGEGECARFADNSKRQGRVVEVFGGCFGDDGDVEFWSIGGMLARGQANGQLFDDVFNSANARREIVRIDEEFHPRPL